MNSLYECQDKRLIADQIEFHDDDDPTCIEMCKAAKLKGTPCNLKVMLFRCLPLTPRDCLSIGYFGRIKSLVSNQEHGYPYIWDFSYEQIMVLELSSYFLSDIGVQALTTELGKGICAPTPTRIHLALAYNHLSERSL